MTNKKPQKPEEFPKPDIKPEPIPGQIPEDPPPIPPEFPKPKEVPEYVPGHIPEGSSLSCQLLACRG